MFVGTKIICQARGVPLPNITWTKSNGDPIGTVPGLRQVRWVPIRYKIQGVPKKMVILSDFEFLTLGGVFLRVKNNSKNSGTKKNIRLFSKILSKMTLLFSKLSHFLEFS